MNAAFGRFARAMVALLIVIGSGCGSGGSRADLESARQFRSFPLYWAGERFEQWELSGIDGVRPRGEFVTFGYGTCIPSGGDEPSCTLPFEIQIFPPCWHLDVVARDPVWKVRRIRSAPLGRNPDGAPALFTRGAQIKVYRGEGSDKDLPLRVLRALRSINDVPPVIGPTGEIPGPARGVLERTRRCRS